jgi:hypothetical protein
MNDIYPMLQSVLQLQFASILNVLECLSLAKLVGKDRRIPQSGALEMGTCTHHVRFHMYDEPCMS